MQTNDVMIVQGPVSADTQNLSQSSRTAFTRVHQLNRSFWLNCLVRCMRQNRNINVMSAPICSIRSVGKWNVISEPEYPKTWAPVAHIYV